MQIDELVFEKLPPHLQAIFVKLHNPGKTEVLAGFPETKSGALTAAHQVNGGFKGTVNCYGTAATGGTTEFAANTGSAARFFYCGKATKRDRDEGLEGFEAKLAGCLNMRNDAHAQANGMTFAPKKNTHNTVKPTAVMRWLCRLITPPGGVVLDPFTGSGSTGKAAVLEGFQFIGIEREAEYVDIARARVAAASPAPPVAAPVAPVKHIQHELFD